MQDGLEDRYVELTTRLRSVEAFCDFLAHGGVVRVAERDGAPFAEVTKVMLTKHRREAEAIRNARRVLFPDRPDEKFPPLYSRH
jgi:hypothetical protein